MQQVLLIALVVVIVLALATLAVDPIALVIGVLIAAAAFALGWTSRSMIRQHIEHQR